MVLKTQCYIPIPIYTTMVNLPIYIKVVHLGIYHSGFEYYIYL